MLPPGSIQDCLLICIWFQGSPVSIVPPIISDATCGAGSVLENKKGRGGYKASYFTEGLLRISQCKSAYANQWHLLPLFPCHYF